MQPQKAEKRNKRYEKNEQNESDEHDQINSKMNDVTQQKLDLLLQKMDDIKVQISYLHNHNQIIPLMLSESIVSNFEPGSNYNYVPSQPKFRPEDFDSEDDDDIGLNISDIKDAHKRGQDVNNPVKVNPE